MDLKMLLAKYVEWMLHVSILRIHIKKNGVSVSHVCPVTEHEFRRNIINVAVDQESGK